MPMPSLRSPAVRRRLPWGRFVATSSIHLNNLATVAKYCLRSAVLFCLRRAVVAHECDLSVVLL
eukprot:6357229-Pyramimonas_sp.AAC.1